MAQINSKLWTQPQPPRERISGTGVLPKVLICLDLRLPQRRHGIVYLEHAAKAVREGTRYAITYQVDGSGHQVTSIKNTVFTWAMGLVKAGSTSGGGTNVPYIEVNFYTPPSDPRQTWAAP